jgi:hypothetical protein
LKAFTLGKKHSMPSLEVKSPTNEDMSANIELGIEKQSS